MAVDTVKLRSPFICPEQVDRIEKSCKLKQQLDLETGVFDYRLTVGSLAGSWDDRLSVRLDVEETYEPAMKRRKEVVRHLIRPYLVVEGSVHKALMGHNVFGGPCDFRAAVRWMLHDLGGRLWVDLPNADEWQVLKVDWAEVYDLVVCEAAREFMHGLNQAQFPRRQVHRYGDTGLLAQGTTTAVKVYRKGAEFLAHDYKRLRGRLTDNEMLGLQTRADGLVRVEVSVKSKKLATDFDRRPLVADIGRDYLEAVWDRESGRLVKQAEKTMETVRTHAQVNARLREFYGSRLAGSLFGTWLQLSVFGEQTVKGSMPARTYYRQRKQLMDAGCSWQGADTGILPRASLIPDGFALTRSDPRRLTEEAEEVVRKLAPFR